MHEPIVVTGLGCISAAGNNIEAFEECLFSSKVQKTIAPVTLFPLSK